MIRIDIFKASQYYLNPYSIPPFLSACLVLSLGFFVFTLEKQSNFNRSFLYLCISTVVWLCGQCLILNSESGTVALFWSAIMYTGFIFMSATTFHISIAYTQRYEQEKRFVVLAYALALMFSFYLWKQKFFGGLQEYNWGFYPDAGVLLPVIFIFLLFYFVLGLLNLISYYKMTPTKITKKQTKHLMIAFIFVFLSYADILPSYGITVYPFGYIAILCFILSVTYAIITYHSLMAKRYTQELEEEVNKKTQELSKAVEQLKKMQVKLFETGKISAMASLSAGILHQISQPITAIHGFVKFMKKEMKKTNRFRKPVMLMDEQTNYLKDMLEDLMELIRHRSIKKERIDVNVCLKKAIDLLTDELRICRIYWEEKLAEGLPQVYADTIHLQQIFMNIIVNATQALGTLPKKEERKIFITSQLGSDGKIVVSFRNTGPGLSKEDEQHIFDPFFSTKTKGSGIGLALCKDLIAEHGGAIEVKNNTPKGVTFIVKLPPAGH